jgi:redox-sensitive bicupin YhaK (pirin superfamily)
MSPPAVHRAADRFRTRAAGIRTRHSFSFGAHYDPANTALGPLVLHDEHRLEPGAGFAPHRHAGVEIVSWVLAGRLVHEDPVFGRHELGPGSLQHLSAGSGLVHAEHAGALPTRFVQAWLLSDRPAARPSYALTAPALDGLTPVLAVGTAVLHAGRLAAGQTARLAAPLLHVFVAGGAVQLGAQRLVPGDAVRCRGEAELELTAQEPAELLGWAMQEPQQQE